jgi:hypothetical protein
MPNFFGTSHGTGQRQECERSLWAIAFPLVVPTGPVEESDSGVGYRRPFVQVENESAEFLIELSA